MNVYIDEAISATLRAPKPRPEFVAGLLASLAAHTSQRVALLPTVDDPTRSPWVVAGTVAAAAGAGIALIGWRLVRRGAA